MIESCEAGCGSVTCSVTFSFEGTGEGEQEDDNEGVVTEGEGPCSGSVEGDGGILFCLFFTYDQKKKKKKKKKNSLWTSFQIKLC